MQNLKRFFLTKDIQEGILFLLLSVWLHTHALTSFQKDFTNEWALSPFLFPRVAAIGFLILGLSIFVGGFKSFRTAEAEEAKQDGSWKALLICIAFVIGYYLVLPLITFLPATILFLAVFMFYLGERGPVILVAVPATAAGFLYVAFGILLNVQLP